jgi:hypothetical protein
MDAAVKVVALAVALEMVDPLKPFRLEDVAVSGIQVCARV